MHRQMCRYFQQWQRICDFRRPLILSFTLTHCIFAAHRIHCNSLQRFYSHYLCRSIQPSLGFPLANVAPSAALHIVKLGCNVPFCSYFCYRPHVCLRPFRVLNVPLPLVSSFGKRDRFSGAACWSLRHVLHFFQPRNHRYSLRKMPTPIEVVAYGRSSCILRGFCQAHIGTCYFCDISSGTCGCCQLGYTSRLLFRFWRLRCTFACENRTTTSRQMWYIEPYVDEARSGRFQREATKHSRRRLNYAELLQTEVDNFFLPRLVYRQWLLRMQRISNLLPRSTSAPLALISYAF